MPPYKPNPSAESTTEAATSAADDGANPVAAIPPTVTDLHESGPAARQRSFLQERLAGAGSGQSTTMRSVAAVATAQPSAAPNLAEDRRRQLTDFRTRQLEQVATTGAIPTTHGPLAAMRRGPLALSTTAAPQRDFLQTNRWNLLGPSVVRDGQSGQRSAMSGRVRGVAVAPGGERLYIATANGGVWRSEDSGHSWLSLMDAFDLNPSLYRADSLACGAIALVPGNWAGEDVIYVGSGEPGVSPWFQGDSAYFGVGPIVSTDGGLNWLTEPSEPSLAGSAFYALAVDPIQPQRVIAATLQGLYRREPDDSGTFRWIRQQQGYFCAVVASQQNAETIFYAAEWGGKVWHSPDGAQWTRLDTDFPNEVVARIGLAVQTDNPEILYALVANVNGHLLGLYRLDRGEERWRPVRGIPPTLFGPDLEQPGQGGYDLAVAVDPLDVNRVYVGGSIVHSDGVQPSTTAGDWSGALYRCELEIQPTTQQISSRSTYIGGSIHGDIHAIQHAPGDPERLWIGCDGGLFFSVHPTANPLNSAHQNGLFTPCNTGLSTLTMNHLGMHPTEAALLFCGTQDNGGLRYTGDAVWLYSSGGDSGYFVVNWHNPHEVATTYVQNQIFRSRDGGMRNSYGSIHVLPASGEAVQFYAPLAGTPHQPTAPERATRLAFGGSRVWLSEQFGGDGVWWDGRRWAGEVDWISLPSNDPTTDRVRGTVEALLFATATKLYAGTTAGTLYRYEEVTEGQWQRTQLPAIASETVAAQIGPVTAIAVDPADASGNAIYVTLGGMHNPHRVWHYDGQQWQPRSGLSTPTTATPASATSAATPPAAPPHSLLNVQHNAIVVDPENPSHLYVAADIGVWRSADGGASWAVFARGLPDAAVVDLELHSASRLLRAATHGRGVYEFDLGRPQRTVDLYIRDHLLDLGRQPAATGVPHPTEPGATVQAKQSPDIKLDPPNADGRYRLTGADPLYVTPFTKAAQAQQGVDFYSFATQLGNDRGAVVTHSRLNVHTQVYVQVHNRGLVTANNVRVMLLLATSSEARETLPPLPANHEYHVRAGLPIASAQWQTVGFATLHGIRAGHPQIATFRLTANQLPTPGQLRDTMQFTLVALVHSTNDPFAATSPTTLRPTANRHVATRAIAVQPFAGRVAAGTKRRQRQEPRPTDFLAEHAVKRGETLSHIAKHYYNSPHHWPTIYRANRRLIGDDPNYLQSGWVLKIPQIDQS